jgi:hypothetical protein
MDPTDVVDEVNALLKLGVGEPYRLEHIKQTYVQNQKIWITDENYLKRLKEKYLIKHTSDVQSDENIVFENEPEDTETIHCWKCGKKGPLHANFCMICGTSLFEVGSNPSSVVEPSNSRRFRKSIPLKIPLLVGIPVLILIILGVGYSQGYFDSALESSNTIPTIENESIFYGEYDSKCGVGTVLDPDTRACVPGLVLDAIDSGDSKCGVGTVFDPDTNACVIR